jgi:serine/threonine protein kinase
MPVDTRKTDLQQVGKYELVERLAEGGMGTVYKARDSITGQMRIGPNRIEFWNAQANLLGGKISGGGIIGLFGVNTVTGAWNMFGEGWQEKEGRTLRLVHGLLMMAADVGFVDTWATGPHSGRLRTALNFENQKTTHRNVAIASISVGSAGYLLMLLGNH